MSASSIAYTCAHGLEAGCKCQPTGMLGGCGLCRCVRSNEVVGPIFVKGCGSEEGVIQDHPVATAPGTDLYPGVWRPWAILRHPGSRKKHPKQNTSWHVC
jgi:hypothetical protein